MVELLSVGNVAPDFDAKDQQGNPVKLSQFHGHPVVLYFYPKDDTPGCTVEACNFRDSNAEYEKKGVKILGVSVDSVNSHKKFNEKYSLNFTLVSDNERRIAESYGVLNGATAKRVTYLIDKSGKIAHVYPSVSPKEHAKEVLLKLSELKLV